MFQNKEVKQFLLSYFFISIIIVLIVFTITTINFNNYKKDLFKNDNYIIDAIVKKYPELEDEIISAIINSNNINSNKLKDYGLNKSYSLDYINNNKTKYKNNLIKNITITLMSLSILLIFFLLLIKYIYNRINKISIYTGKVLNDDYQMDIREYEEGTISTLKNDIYKMTTKMKEATENAKNDKIFLESTLEDISHQLKTPLTSMYVINDILYKEENKKIRTDFLNKNKEQLERIEWLVSSILKISRLDSGTIKLNKKNIDVHDLIEKTIKPLLIPAELKKIQIKNEIKEKITIKGDLNWTSEALLNIIKNAYEHTNTYVSINANDNPIYTEITIKDDGCGIDEADLPHIFERFYKGKTSNKNSIGIGLNMAKTIINKENGDIFVETNKNGTTFIIKFYKNIMTKL